jgi:hypothetical protein
MRAKALTCSPAFHAPPSTPTSRRVSRLPPPSRASRARVAAASSQVASTQMSHASSRNAGEARSTSSSAPAALEAHLPTVRRASGAARPGLESSVSASAESFLPLSETSDA